MGDHLVVFVVAFATVVVATPITKRIAWQAGAVATPGERHVHTRPVPTIGGLAIFSGVLAAIAVGSQLEGFDLVFRTTAEPEVIVLGALLVVVLGLLDDVRGVSAPAKLAGQILAAAALPLFGLAVQFVYVPGALGVVNLSADLAALLTIVGIVAMINAVNLIDGLDGLAAGVVLIAAAALFAYTQFNQAEAIEGASAAPLVLAATAGACLGFLVYNFHPASIFMGDTGAMLLGLLLGAAAVSAISGTVQPGRGDFAAVTLPILVPVLVLAIPFVDTVWTILRRLRGGRAIFSADKEHLHHRLLEIGHSHRRAVLVMYYWSALLAFAGVGGSVLPRHVVLLVLGVAVALAVVSALLGRLARRARPGLAAVRRDDQGDEVVLSFTRGPRRKPKSGSDQRKRRPREF